ncbi:uncharacterized protein B0J16DRAFT_181886 [Fusarium flagelliforme]|uniref:Uncharacterized protein n=1 Tax=Fusarium flagelliforme TaxID=2675880 RepID=A0A395MH22_9HYPO|nr:uncharacterized protein B0J16DRAFT_181886 [Fusarium flagelliforme]KAH7174403.1 hypothetical protein B0J16DRAFT_181886 [Fusarium flagelliforme]RFN47155.1 hypothetical protein FIE12Z_8611 [Fusarium flagelliforme]
MATLSTLDVNTTSSAVASWRWNEVTRFLAEPDPQIRDITFTTRFDNTATFFQLNIPIRIKGIKTGTTLILRIPPTSISSFEVTAQSPAVPSAVRDKFPSSTSTLLDLQLNAHPEVLVSTQAQEPLAPLRAQSGTVLDALHELANSTALSIYIKGAHKAQLQAVCDAIGNGKGNGLSLVIQHDLLSMYGGVGAKVITFPVPQTESLPPPSYDQTEPPPPHAPIFETRKRRRKDDGGEERDEDIALIWAQLEKIQTRHGLELKALREENLDLRDEVDDLRKRLAASEKSHQDLKDEYDALATRMDVKVDELGDEIDVKLIDTKSDIQELTESVKSLREDADEDKLVDRVKYKVFDHLRTSLSHDMSPAD